MLVFLNLISGQALEQKIIIFSQHNDKKEKEASTLSYLSLNLQKIQAFLLVEARSFEIWAAAPAAESEDGE